MEEAAREAAHKQQRWLTLAPSPRADHHHAELTVPPITAQSDWDEGDNVEKSERFRIISSVLVVGDILGSFLHKMITFSHSFTFDITHTRVHSFSSSQKKKTE